MQNCLGCLQRAFIRHRMTALIEIDVWKRASEMPILRNYNAVLHLSEAGKGGACHLPSSLSYGDEKNSPWKMDTV